MGRLYSLPLSLWLLLIESSFNACLKIGFFMKLDGLQIFLDRLEKHCVTESLRMACYYLKGSEWTDFSSGNAASSSDQLAIKRAMNETICYCASSSKKAWFYLSEFEAVVCLIFQKAPRSVTRGKAREDINRVQEAAINAYKVNYNQLTQLLSRDAFREKLLEIINKNKAEVLSTVETQDGELPRLFAVMALDIDHFKQVNDTWGHLYGDMVLKVFSLRLEVCAKTIREQGFGNPSVLLSHPSGEEFLIIVEAGASKEQFLEWANDFRRAIGENALPSESECRFLSVDDNGLAERFPPLHERNITTSIGVVFHHVLAQDEGVNSYVSVLLEKADTALYKAKSSGRNQAISYEDILSGHGRIIEQDEITKIVALDIGTNVGVTIGQEFKVYLPKFSGREKFYVNDGRTKRALGAYPRVESARIVVFNAQPELSFAYIESPEEALILDVGSHLEAIPAGSIGHLLTSAKSAKYFSSSTGSAGIGGIDSLQEFVNKNENFKPFAVVIRFSNSAELLRKHGTVSLNKALAQLYRDVQLIFHDAGGVEVIDKESICVVGLEGTYNEGPVADLINNIALKNPELNVIAGVFCEKDKEVSDTDELELISKHAIEFARFAAVDAGRSPDNRIRHFNYGVVYDVLQSLRASKLLDIAYADYKKLKALGVESPIINNLGGVIASALGLFQDALECYAAAISKDESIVIYKSNYGSVAYSLDETESALQVLSTISDKELEELKSTHEYGYFGYARLLAKAHENRSSLFNRERFLLIAENVLPMNQFRRTPGYFLISKVMSEINSSTP